MKKKRKNSSRRQDHFLTRDASSFFSMKPTLKKVSKYENKFAKLQKKAAEFNFRNQLKQVKKKEFTLEEEDKEVRTMGVFFFFYRNFASKRDASFITRELFFTCLLIEVHLLCERVFIEFIKTQTILGK